ncbi:MAG: Crp/Fnr family transcriptional regulator [Pseudomonadota bacterium]
MFDRPFSTTTLSGASEPLVDLLSEIADDTSLEQGETLFHQGDAGDALYALRSGRLEVSVVSEDGRKLTLNTLGTGDVFGEIALFDNGPRTATLTALEACRLARVNRERLFDEVRQRPALAIDLIELAGKRLRWVSAALEDMTFQPLSVRLARRLLYLSAQGGAVQRELTLSQAELADHVGGTRETVSKTLAGWRREGVIAVNRGRLEILDRAALQALAQDPATSE